MSTTGLVRTSRDGDQFHYVRGARLCLELLAPGSTLIAVTIEGVTPSEEDIGDGLDVIDLALYEGATDIARATRIRYRQFKHSTRHAAVEWTASGLRKTLEGFAARYAELVRRFGYDDVAARFSFEFETNRPISSDVGAALAALASGGNHPAATYLRCVIPLTGEDLQRFAGLVHLLPGASDYLAQRQLLDQDFRVYLPDGDRDAPLKLKELVTRKATSEYAVNPVITREDVLHSIGTDVEDLFPARPLIETPSPLVVREQLPSLVREVLTACGAVILEADGGVGKTVVATHLASGLPTGSASFVYDCFGNGAYRSSSGYRHRARDGLVQLANEMATAALCDPLIPTSKADAAAYVRAFIGRLHQASTVLAARAPDAVLMIVIDAADNAQMAADEAQDGPSFPRLLLRETFPPNARLVFTARPHRTYLLNPPPDIPRIQLLAFSEVETSAHVYGRFPNASIQDVREFHRLTSQNPRVQRAALDAGASISDVLAALGPTPRSVDDTIGALLEAAIATVRDSAASVEQPQIDRVCVALATLRPFVPLDIVATTAGVPVELVRSIAHDLRRPLLIRDDAVQFRDEPTETWFRERYRPQSNELRGFIECLRPLATTSAYVAATLPPLMLEAGDFDALVQLALSGEGLPTQNAISRRDVELQRLQFALKAALRSRRFSEAAKLALKAGGEAAADARQQTLLSSNTDLASRFLDVHQLLEQVSRRLVVGGGWTGSEHAYEAALLSGNQALAGDARSRLRLAYDWVNHWARARVHDETSRERMEDADIAELQFAELNLHGVDVCAKQLRRWRPREVSFRVGKLLIGRLVDASRTEEIDALCIAAGNDLGLLLAAMVKLRDVGRVPPKAAVKRAATLVLSRHVVLEPPGDWRGEERRLEAINALVLAACYHGVGSKRDLARLLTKYLPKDPPRDFYSRHFHDSRFVYLRAYTLRAMLQKRLPSIESLAHPEIRKAVRDKNWHNTDAGRLREHIGALLPWHTLGIEVLLAKVPPKDIEAKIEAARQATKAAEGHPAYGEPSPTANEIARIWCELIVGSTAPAGLWLAFTGWQSQLKHPLSIPTLAALARQAAHCGGRQTMALDLAHRAFQLAQQTGETAESQADTYVTLARAVLPASNDEAQRYFEEAIVVSSRIGEEHLDRWSALLDLADASANERCDEPQAAYRLARAAELIYSYVARDKYFDWEHTVAALAGLSARSALTTLSRWNDRRFGWNSRLLPALVSALLKRSALDARDVLPLVGFEAQWDYPGLLTDALGRAIDGKERHALATYAFYYLRFAGLSVEDWRRVHTLFQSWEFDDLDVGPMLERAERAAAERSPTRPETTASVEKKVVDWDGVFAGLDLGAAGDLQTALARYRDVSSPLRNNDLLREAMSRIADGQERAFIKAFAATTPDLYDLRSLLESLPADWNARVAVRPALVLLTKETYRRCARSVSVRSHWQPLPFELVARTTGLSTVELIREAVDALASSPLPVDAGELFQLSGLLSKLITVEAGADALSYGLDLLESALDADVGDGPWTPELMPPETMETALAGYLWAALGSIEASRRWQAAHAVRGFCQLGRVTVLNELVAAANKREGGSFVDRRFRFYDLHALQWLLIAFCRATKDSGATVARYADFLKDLAVRSNPHVLMRGVAADALIDLHAQGCVALSVKDLQSLKSINQSRLPPIQLPAYSRGPTRAAHRRPVEERFVFDYDFDRHTIAPLANSFALSDDDVKALAEGVIRDTWGLSDNGHWDNDARAMRGFFREDRRRYQHGASHRDTLSFYLSYHALMVAAGQLLDTTPLPKDSENTWASFRSWIVDQGLTRLDGFWLADRRDATPGDCQSLPDKPEPEWSSSLSDEDIPSILQPSPNLVIVAGWWMQYAGKRRQRVCIESALVTPDRRDALIRALVSTINRHDYRIPDFGDDCEIDQGGYVFKGWVSEHGNEERIDAQDPWAAGLGARTLAPAQSFATLLQLHPVALQRSWHDANGEPVLWSEIWSDGDDDEARRPSSGRRLIATRALLDRLMEASGQSLLIQASIERKLSPYSYESKFSKEDNHGSEVTSIITLQPQGAIKQFRRSPRARRKASRRVKTR